MWSLHAPSLSYVIMHSCTYQLASLLHANECNYYVAIEKCMKMIQLVEIKTADSTYARTMTRPFSSFGRGWRQFPVLIQNIDCSI